MATDAEIMPKVTTSEEELSSSVSDTASETSYKEIWKRGERIRETTPNFSMVLFILGVCLTAPTLTFCIVVEYASAKTGKTTTTDIVALAVPTVVQQIAIRWFLKHMKSVEIYSTLAMSLAGLSGIALIPQRDGRIAGVSVLGFGTYIGLKQICEQADKELKQFALFWFNNGCFIGLILGGLVHKALTHWGTLDRRTATIASAVWPVVSYAVALRDFHYQSRRQRQRRRRSSTSSSSSSS